MKKNELYSINNIYELYLVITIKDNNTPIMIKFFVLTSKKDLVGFIEDIKKSREANQPILVGTTSIETSEYLSSLLKKLKIVIIVVKKI